MLFSEPKIPQFKQTVDGVRRRVRFQCSSASRKFLNAALMNVNVASPTCFSALQRAENSSMLTAPRHLSQHRPFQCSSASRKFLNSEQLRLTAGAAVRFSALQRAENSSRSANWSKLRRRCVSVLFSEPKIPQSHFCTSTAVHRSFQCSSASRKFLNIDQISVYAALVGFSALQRAENSSTPSTARWLRTRRGFSALQRAENSSTTATSAGA